MKDAQFTANLIATVDIVTRRMFHLGQTVIYERSVDFDADLKALFHDVNAHRARGGLEPLPRPDHWTQEDDAYPWLR